MYGGGWWGKDRQLHDVGKPNHPRLFTAACADNTHNYFHLIFILIDFYNLFIADNTHNSKTLLIEWNIAGN